MQTYYNRFFAYIRSHLWLPVAALDMASVVGVLFGKDFVKLMFRYGKPCPWERFDAKCATCGGTHCVLSFLQGHFAESFAYNPMVFAWILYGIATVLLLNLRFIFRQQWAQSVLRRMYSLPALWIALGAYFSYMIVRNLPFI